MPQRRFDQLGRAPHLRGTYRRAPSARGMEPSRTRRGYIDQRIPLIAGGAVLAMALLLAISGIVGLFAPPPEAARHEQMAIVEAPGIPATPDHLWGAGGLPYFYQTDERWAEKPYAGVDIKTSGCGPTCLSMVYMWATGKTDMDPVALCKFSEENGYVEGDATRWSLMYEGARALGLDVRQLGVNPDEVKAALEDGEVLIVVVEPGDFTTVGHFMVISGITADNHLVIHDPNSPQNSLKRWPMLQVLSQTKSLWAYTAEK